VFAAEIEQLMNLDDLELHNHVRHIELERRTLDARHAAAIAVANTRQLNTVIDGHRSMTSYLRAELNYSTLEAKRWLQTATMVDALPAVGDAWINGHIGSPQTTTFAKTFANRRVRDRLPEFIPTLLEHAEQLPYTDFATCINTFTTLADQDGAHHDRDHNITTRRASAFDVGGTLELRMAGGDALTAAEMIAIHRAFTEREYTKDIATRRQLHGDDADNHDLARTNTQRSFDAIIEIFRQATTSTTPGQPIEPVVNIIIDAHTFANIQHHAGLTPTTPDGQPIDPFTGVPNPTGLISDLLGQPDQLRERRCETSTGTPLHPHDILRATLAGHTRRVILDSNDVIINMGRKTRLYTGSARTAAKLLIRHCQRPGCELPADFSQIDHNHEWNTNGQTNQNNAGIMCGPDNRHKHRERWQRQRSRNGNHYTIRADGTIILPVGARTPTFPSNDDTDVGDQTDTYEQTDTYDWWNDPDEIDFGDQTHTDTNVDSGEHSTWVIPNR
jgi:Domain of unknown function (DUF222)